MALAYSVIGVNEWAVRLPSALSAIGLVSLGFYVLWAFGKKDCGRRNLSCSSTLSAMGTSYKVLREAELHRKLCALSCASGLRSFELDGLGQHSLGWACLGITISDCIGTVRAI